MTTAAQDAPSASSLPAKRLAGRQVVVLLGASEPALSLLAHALQALGVDMLDPESPAGGEAGEWRRGWAADINARLLAAIDRAPDHFAHALPFPPGWWRRPAVQALKREAIAALEAGLEGHEDLWGFADVATARLLPVWLDVFERLGLSPVFVWSLTHPARAPAVEAADLASAAAASEVRWFAYSSDIFRYGADQIACVVDESDWRTDPQGLMESLVQHLHLRWRGTRLDLYETVGAVLAQGLEASADEGPLRPAALPLSASFYRAAQLLEDDPEARARLTSIVENAELLRPLIAPFLPALQVAAAEEPPEPKDDPALLRQEIAALRETCAELRRPAQVEPAQDQAAQAQPDEGRTAVLEMELDARRAEIRWLHDRHAAEMREVEQELEELRRRLAEGQASAGATAGETGSAPQFDAGAEVARLQAEMVTLTNANERYLARIYELKKALEDGGAFERAGR